MTIARRRDRTGRTSAREDVAAAAAAAGSSLITQFPATSPWARSVTSGSPLLAVSVPGINVNPWTSLVGL